MTRFIDTDAADAFIASGASRETSPEVMRAIAQLAANEAEAVRLWEDGEASGVAYAVSVWEIATSNGARSGDNLFWGGRSLTTIMAEG